MALGSGPQLTSCFSFSQLNSNTVKTFSDDGAQSVNYLYQNGYGEIVATTEDEVSSALALKSDLAALTLSISSTDDLNAFLAASSIGQLAFCHMTATFTTGSQGSGFVKKMSATIVDMLYMIDTCNIMTCRYDSSSGTLTKYKIALTKVE